MIVSSELSFTSSPDYPFPLIHQSQGNKADKYTRYLADVYVGEQYLNNELLQEGLAVRL